MNVTWCWENSCLPNQISVKNIRSWRFPFQKITCENNLIIMVSMTCSINFKTHYQEKEDVENILNAWLTLPDSNEKCYSKNQWLLSISRMQSHKTLPTEKNWNLCLVKTDFIGKKRLLKMFFWEKDWFYLQNIACWTTSISKVSLDNHNLKSETAAYCLWWSKARTLDCFAVEVQMSYNSAEIINLSVLCHWYFRVIRFSSMAANAFKSMNVMCTDSKTHFSELKMGKNVHHCGTFVAKFSCDIARKKIFHN